MFERFTDRARRVLVLAQEEARLLDHSFIGTEHVLLGLIHEGDGVAAQALQALEITLEDARDQVEGIIGLSGTAPTGSPPFTPRAKKVLELALREALQLGHNFIGTEHMLLGLVREGEGVAAQVLVNLGVDLARVRQQVIQLLGATVQEPSRGHEGGGRRHAWVSSSPGARPGAGRLLLRTGDDSCSFCGRDLWDVGRFVSAAWATICEECVATALSALAGGGAPPPGDLRAGEVLFPPHVYGEAPDGSAVDEVVRAFLATFGPTPPDRAAFEDAEELEPYLARAGLRHGGTVRLRRMRFLDDDTAEAELVLGPGDTGVVQLAGRAVRRRGSWLVSRDTVLRVLRRAGTSVPPATQEPPGAQQAPEG